MIAIFIALFALLLAIIAFCLIQKPQLFLPLIGETPENRSFLRQFGIVYLLVALLGIVAILLEGKLVAFGYLLLALLVTLAFSILFSRKMNLPK